MDELVLLLRCVRMSVVDGNLGYWLQDGVAYLVMTRKLNMTSPLLR